MLKGAGHGAGQKQAVQHGVGRNARTSCVTSVDTLVLILGKSPYKDKIEKMVLIWFLFWILVLILKKLKSEQQILLNCLSV